MFLVVSKHQNPHALFNLLSFNYLMDTGLDSHIFNQENDTKLISVKIYLSAIYRKIVSIFSENPLHQRQIGTTAPYTP